MTLQQMRPGMKLYTYWDTGAMGIELFVCEVVRINRVTVTVRTPSGDTKRAHPSVFIGPYTEESAI